MGLKLTTQQNKKTIEEHANAEYQHENKRSENKIKECSDVTNDHWNIKSENHVFTDQTYVQLKDTDIPLFGNHETQESEDGEADLHKYLVGCKKNPGHRQFIPVDTFNLKHLPEGLQDNDLYEYIKVTADMTVRVSVQVTSPHRPKFWLETTQPYPFYNRSDTRNLRTGSGWVCDVEEYQNGVWQDGYGGTDYKKCWCRPCKDSDSPSNVWWEFYVYTATHVVFDEIEASHTTLRFFYNSDDSPMVTVDNVIAHYVDIESDRCILKCVTCDKHLGNRLKADCKQYWHVKENLYDKYCNTRSKHKFNFIVSHPHGCSKQLSVGQWKDLHNGGHNKTKFTYTTCTCPGSSGARVHSLGWKDWGSAHVHSGSLKPGLNCSSEGGVM